MYQYNKFLQKRANSRSAVTQSPTQTPDAQQGWWGRVRDNMSKAKLAYDLFGATGMDTASKFGDAAGRLQAYENGTAKEGYDPLYDMQTVSNTLESKDFQNRYANWAKDPVNRQKKWYNQLEYLQGRRDALRYAVRNPKDFRYAQKFQGMGLMDYLLGSASDNYNVMRIASGPLGKFMKPQQRTQLRNNFGLMKMIWRIKKFFSEFGNWRNVRDPEDPQAVDPTVLKRQY